MPREIIERYTCDGCGKAVDRPAPPENVASELPPGWSSWTVTDWARHRDLRPGDPGHYPATSTLLTAHEPACAKRAMAAFVDESTMADRPAERAFEGPHR